MGRAAGDGAAGGQQADLIRAALAVRCSADRATMAWVLERLRATMAGVDPLSRHEHLRLPAGTLERRTATPLRHAGRP